MNPAWQLLRSDGPALHALLWRLTLRADAAEDLLQELFIKLTASSGFARADDRAAYARRAAINLAMDWRRQRRRAPGDLGGEDPPAGGPGPAAAAEEADEIGRILDAAGRLGALPREAFVLRYVQDESYERVGQILGKSAHQARGICHAAVKAVREQLATREVTLEQAG
jgi:RNA polymerase sigma factor (sigma-70 family)